MRRHAILFVVVMLLAAHGLAQAQTDASQTRFYRLTDKSLYQDGCFAPCLCPVLISNGITGTFRLTFASQDSLYTYYTVDQVNWIVPLSSGEVRITGSGTYRVGGEFALTEELKLDLKVGDRDVQTYDSGLVAGGSEFPAINLTISRNGMICQDTAITVASVPILAADIAPFTLGASAYEVGCFGPCDCAITSQPVAGGFGLVKLAASDGFVTFGVLGVDWKVQSTASSGSSASFPVTGYGLYQVTSPPGKQRMLLDLSLDGKSPQPFDSGLVPGGGNPFRIDVLLAANGFACFDQVFDLHARRVRPVVTLQSDAGRRDRRHGKRATSPLPPQ
jgi:hypothetical protein